MRRLDRLGLARIQHNSRVFRISVPRDFITVLCFDGCPIFYGVLVWLIRMGGGGTGRGKDLWVLCSNEI